MSNLPPLPLKAPLIVSMQDPTITKEWESSLRARDDRIQVAAVQVTSARVALSGQTAAIALTAAIPSAAGLYRVNWRFRVTTAAGVSSSLQLTVTTTDGAVACPQSSAAYTGNAVNAPQSGAFTVKCDPGTPLSYSTVYASNPGAQMVYELEMRIEAL